jgi:ATP-dependent RNA helicase SUPV3L1/SUV3
MLSITGMTLEQFADLMGGLGYTAEKGEREKVKTVEKPKELTAEEIHAEAERRAAAEAAMLTAEALAEAGATESETAATEAPAAEGPEMETFYTFVWRPKPRERAPRPDRTRPEGQPRRDGADARGKPGGERRGKPGGKPGGERRGKPKGKRDEHQGGGKSFEARPPRREKPIDPDNPFAVLAALKGKD